MARRRSGFSPMLSLALSVMAAMCAASTAQQQQQQPPAVPTAPSCPPVQASLLPCVSYFIGNSSSPSTACCSQMQAMFQSQAPCLCAAVAAAPSQLGSVPGQVLPGLPLPSACNLPTNACSDATGTSSSAPAGGSAVPSSGIPAAAAAPVTGPAGTIPATPSGGGSKSVPGLLVSAAVGAECMRISAAAVFALATFLAAYVF